MTEAFDNRCCQLRMRIEYLEYWVENYTGSLDDANRQGKKEEAARFENGVGLFKKRLTIAEFELQEHIKNAPGPLQLQSLDSASTPTPLLAVTGEETVNLPAKRPAPSESVLGSPTLSSFKRRKKLFTAEIVSHCPPSFSSRTWERFVQINKNVGFRSYRHGRRRRRWNDGIVLEMLNTEATILLNHLCNHHDLVSDSPSRPRPSLTQILLAPDKTSPFPSQHGPLSQVRPTTYYNVSLEFILLLIRLCALPHPCLSDTYSHPPLPHAPFSSTSTAAC